MPISEWEAHSTEDGETFYYNRKTGKSSWETPQDNRTEQDPQGSRTGDWAALWSEGDGMHYYYNKITGATQWSNKKAPAIAWKSVKIAASIHDLTTRLLAHLPMLQEIPEAAKISLDASAARVNPPANSAAAAPQERMAPREATAHNAHGFTSSAAVNFDFNQHHGSRLSSNGNHAQFHNVSPGNAATSSSGQEAPEPRRHSSPSCAHSPSARSVTAYTAPMSLGAAEGNARDAGAAVRGRRPASISTSEREGATLRQALTRKEDSLKRLKDARAAAQERIAKLKADAATRRAAKSSAAGKAAASVVPPSGDLDGTGSTPSASRGMDSTIVTPALTAAMGDESPEGVRLVDMRVETIPISAAEHATSSPSDALVSRGGPATISSRSLLPVEAGENSGLASPVDSDSLAAGEAKEGPIVGVAEGGAGHVFGTAEDSSRQDDPADPDLLASQLAKGMTIIEETDGEMVPRRVNLQSSADGGEACSGFLLGVSSVGEAIDFGAVEAWDEAGVEYDEEVRKGWEEASLLGIEASEELSKMLAATRKSDANGVLPPSLWEDPNGDRRHDLDQRATRGDSFENQGDRQKQNFVPVALANRALDRVTRLFELLASVGEERAWLGRVSAQNHRACRRLVDFAATGARLLLLLPRQKDQATPFGELDSPGREEAPAAALGRLGRSICYSSLGCLALCGRISPDMWADLSREDNGASESTAEALEDPKGGAEALEDPKGGAEALEDPKGGGEALEDPKGGAETLEDPQGGVEALEDPKGGVEALEDPKGGAEALEDPRGGGGAEPAETAAEEGDLGLETTSVTWLLSNCVDLVRSASCEEEGHGRTGLDEEEYFFGKNEADGDREGGDAGNLGGMALKLIFEVLTGCCKARVDRLRDWEGTGRLVDSLMDTVVKAREDSYMMATRALLAANDPFWRCPPPPSPSIGLTNADPEPAPVSPPSVIIPALSTHPARHDVQSAVLHILNEEGYPNGDSELARLCLVFCGDAFEAESSKALFYLNDVKLVDLTLQLLRTVDLYLVIMVDVAIRELSNLPTDDPLREDYGRLLRRILEKSEWGTRGERYREAAIHACTVHGREPSERDT